MVLTIVAVNESFVDFVQSRRKSQSKAIIVHSNRWAWSTSRGFDWTEIESIDWKWLLLTSFTTSFLWVLPCVAWRVRIDPGIKSKSFSFMETSRRSPPNWKHYWKIEWLDQDSSWVLGNGRLGSKPWWQRVSFRSLQVTQITFKFRTAHRTVDNVMGREARWLILLFAIVTIDHKDLCNGFRMKKSISGWEK
jgi:hypothetical protein